MPSSPSAGDPGADDAPGMTLLAAPQVLHGASRRRPEGGEESQEIRPVEEIEADIRRSNDKERAIGLVAAPVAAIIGLHHQLRVHQVRQDPQPGAVRLRRAHVRPSRLAVLILLTSWLRKRLFQGITLALYGLAIFQLHYT